MLVPSAANAAPASSAVIGIDLGSRVGEREDHLTLADHLGLDQPWLAAGRDDDIGLAHHVCEVDDLDPAGARVLLRRRVRVGGEHAPDAGVVDQRRDPEAGGAEADLADDGLVEPDVRPGGRRRSAPRA